MVASWACEVTEILTQRSTEENLLCEDYSDLTSPISHKIPDMHTAVSVVYDTYKIFLHVCSYCLIRHFDCDMNLLLL